MSDKRILLKSSLGYAIAQIIGFSVSLLSFPILTRILPVAEYGVLGLCSTSLLIGCAVSKLGLQNSIIRFYHDYRKRDALDTFYSTFWWGGIGAAALVSLLLIPVFMFLAPVDFRGTFFIVVLVVFCMSIFSIITNFLRTEERNITNAVVSLVFKVISTFIGIALIYFWDIGISGIFIAQFAVLALITAKYANVYFNRFSLHTKLVSPALFKEALSFGAPLIAFEVSSIALAFSDRYLITYFCGVEQLGIYTAGYTLCFYIADLIKQPLNLSIVPIYLRLYTEKGVDATVTFIREIVGYVFLVICPVFAGTCAIKEDLLVLLASDKYSEASAVIPWVLGSTLLYGCQPIIAAGFTIKKQTRGVSVIIVIGASLNVLLNLILLPRFGFIGAAWSTALAYVGVLFAMTIISARIFPLSLPYGRIAFYLLSSGLMYLTVDQLRFASLSSKISCGVFVYCLLILFFDRKIRNEVLSLISGRLTFLRSK